MWSFVCSLSTPKRSRPKSKRALQKAQKGKQPAILVINKIDLIKEKTDLLSVILEYNKLYDFAAVVPVSAKNGDGFDGLMEEIDKFAEDGIHMFDEDTLTDQPERVLAAEFIREKLLRTPRQGNSHGTAVVIERFKDRDDGILDIDATIFAKKKTHKGHYNRQGRRNPQAGRNPCAAGYGKFLRL